MDQSKHDQQKPNKPTRGVYARPVHHLRTSPIRFSREEFDQLVEQALGDVPEEFRDKLDNVYITVEDNPTPENYRETRTHPEMLLLGVYQGIPLNHRSMFQTFAMPDNITLFQRPIEIIGKTRAGVIRQIRRTILHEIAHHFGISDARLRELGY